MSGIIKFAHGVFNQAINAVIIAIINAHGYHRHSALKAQLLTAINSINSADLETKLPANQRTTKLSFQNYYAKRVSLPQQVNRDEWFDTVDNTEDTSDTTASADASSSSSSSSRRGRRTASVAQTPGGQPKLKLTLSEQQEFIDDFNVVVQELEDERRDVFNRFASLDHMSDALYNELKDDSKFLEYQTAWDVISLIDLIRTLAMRGETNAASEAVQHAMSLQQPVGQTISDYNKSWSAALAHATSLGANLADPVVKSMLSDAYLKSILPEFNDAVKTVRRTAIASNTSLPKVQEVMKTMETEARVLGIHLPTTVPTTKPATEGNALKAAATTKTKDDKEVPHRSRERDNSRRAQKRNTDPEARFLVLQLPRYQNDEAFQEKVESIVQKNRPQYQGNRNRTYITEEEDVQSLLQAITEQRTKEEVEAYCARYELNAAKYAQQQTDSDF